MTAIPYILHSGTGSASNNFSLCPLFWISFTESRSGSWHFAESGSGYYDKNEEFFVYIKNDIF